MAQLVIRNFPQRSKELLDEIVAKTGYTKVQVIVLAIEFFYREITKEGEAKETKTPAP